ncbi:MAG: ABC transporter ATP-binding protein [Burkholderiales bacterium]|nr:ABC transporter ATP-binding protein [Burkholderiales bacterium]
MLELIEITARFDGVTALSEVSFSLGEGEFLGLIGPNGAGKTTTLNAISRLYEPASGDIRLGGESLLHRAPHEVIRAGIVRTFQNLALCPRLSVEDNVMLGGLWRSDCGALSYWFGTPRSRAAARQFRAIARDAMAAIGIGHLAHSPVASLSYGARRRVELARCLCAQPRLMLLDEPASGLTDDEASDLVELLKGLRNSHGLSLIVIEHHLDVVMALSDRVVVLDGGKVIAQGPPDEVSRDPHVVEAYLGAGA